MSRRLGILIIFLFALVPLLWFKPGFIISGGDQVIYLNPASGLKSVYLWDRFSQGGTISGYTFILFPFLTFFGLAKLFGASAIFSQKIWFVLLYLGPMLSMYYLYGVVAGKERSYGRILASIFFVFNIYFFTMNPLRSSDFFLAATAAALILAFFIKGLNEPNKRGKYLVLVALSSLMISGVNLALFLVVFFIALTYFYFFFWLIEKIILKSFALG